MGFLFLYPALTARPNCSLLNKRPHADISSLRSKEVTSDYGVENDKCFH